MQNKRIQVLKKKCPTNRNFTQDLTQNTRVCSYCLRDKQFKAAVISGDIRTLKRTEICEKPEDLKKFVCEVEAPLPLISTTTTTTTSTRLRYKAFEGSLLSPTQGYKCTLVSLSHKVLATQIHGNLAGLVGCTPSIGMKVGILRGILPYIQRGIRSQT